MAKLWQYAIAGIIIAVVAVVCIFWAVSATKSAGLCPDSTSPFSNPLVFIPKLKECFPLYTQGPCREGQWLAHEKLQLNCVENNCIEHFNMTVKPEEQTIVPFKNACYNLGDSCGDGNKKQIMYNESGHVYCSEVPKVHTGYIGGPGKGGRCEGGYFRFKLHCLPPNAGLLDEDDY